MECAYYFYAASQNLVPLIGITVAQETTRSQALRQSLVTSLHRAWSSFAPRKYENDVCFR